MNNIPSLKLFCTGTTSNTSLFSSCFFLPSSHLHGSFPPSRAGSPQLLPGPTNTEVSPFDFTSFQVLEALWHICTLNHSAPCTAWNQCLGLCPPIPPAARASSVPGSAPAASAFLGRENLLVLLENIAPGELFPSQTAWWRNCGRVYVMAVRWRLQVLPRMPWKQNEFSSARSKAHTPC